MTFTILQHGVKNNIDFKGIDENGREINIAKFSIAQDAVIKTKKPIVTYSAPTGSGKTFIFQQVIKTGKKVLFIVPTRALAANIKKSCLSSESPVFTWDSDQTALAKKNGIKNTYAERSQHLKEIANGGMIVSTLEVFGAITLGVPMMSGIKECGPDIIKDFDYVVFDESHTLGTRTFGLLLLWSLYIKLCHDNELAHPKLVFLSATHSNFFEFMMEEHGGFINESMVDHIEEELSEQPERIIHGNVTVHAIESDLINLLRQNLQSALEKSPTVIIIFDNLKTLKQCECTIAGITDKCGLKRNEVILINGIDRGSNTSTTSSGFDTGIDPLPRHRVIIGTSAVELGVTYYGANHGFTDNARDAASLLQRLGRQARGPVDGVVYVSVSAPQLKHVDILLGISGEISITDFRKKFGKLREIDGKTAWALAGAYLSMLHQVNGQIFNIIVATSIARGIDIPLPTMKSLDKLRRIAESNDDMHVWRTKNFFIDWVKAIDKELRDLRGFSPVVKMRFKGDTDVEYSLDWAETYLRNADDIDGDVFVFHRGIEEYFLNKPAPPYIRAFSPVGELDITGWKSELFTDYKHKFYNAKKSCDRSAKKYIEEAYELASEIRLIPRVKEDKNICDSSLRALQGLM